VEPKIVKIALQDTKWFGAMQDELLALQWKNTRSLVPLPPNFHTSGCKRVFCVMGNPNGISCQGFQFTVWFQL